MFYIKRQNKTERKFDNCTFDHNAMNTKTNCLLVVFALEPGEASATGGGGASISYRRKISLFDAAPKQSGPREAYISSDLDCGLIVSPRPSFSHSL